MNPIDQLPFLGETKESAEVLFAKAGITNIEWVNFDEVITLQVRNHPVVFLNRFGRIEEIW